LRITLIIGKGKDKVAVVDKTEDKKKTTNNSNSTVICIDPGHQTHANLSGEPVGPGSSTIKPKVSGGATGISTGVPEYKIALAVSLKLKSLLEERGYKVIMTRETNNVNISNSERAKIANKAKAALFVRIHADSSTSQSVNGYSVLYPAKNQWTENIYNKSIRAAQIVSDKLSATGAKNNGIVPRADITGFNWSKVPVILIESGFLSNPSEDRSLNKSSYQQKIAKSITSGIVSFLSK
jgi:N-acetylmuramoyl-L-alanine amidase